MEISEVRVKLIMNPTDRLKAFCSITLDGEFVIRDIKLIEGGSGIFVAMPSRKLADHCPKCRAKNHLRARYCNECGAALAKERVKRDRIGRKKLHADIAHPINSECRQRLQELIVEAFEKELAASEQPGYEPVSYDDSEDEYESGDDYREMIEELKRDARDAREKTARTTYDDSEDLDTDDSIDEADDDDEPESHEDELEAPVGDDREPAPALRSSQSEEEDRDTADDDFGAGIL